MPRKPRYLQLAEDADKYVRDRVHNRETIFAHDEDKAAFLALIFIHNKFRSNGLGKASPFTALWDAVNDRETVFARELRQLKEAGYKQVGDYMVPPE